VLAAASIDLHIGFRALFELLEAYWWAVRRTSRHVALQSTVVGLGLDGLVAMELAQMRPVPVEVARWLPLIPLVAAGLFVRFWLMERSASNASCRARYEL